MKVSRKWLNRLVKIEDISTDKLADVLTNAGLEVETIDTLASGTNLTIGHVLECVEHPDSDHLHVTKVNLGDRVEQIVCGAPNVAANQKVIVAKVGAVLPQMEIKAAKVRGVESNGMLCSLRELGVDEKLQSENDLIGIKVLDDNAPIGGDPLAYLGLDDEILDIKQTPNRSDFNAMQSIAYEVSALFNRELIVQPTLQLINSEAQPSFKVDSKTKQCSYFLAKEIKHVTVKESPQWIQQALISSGMHPINNIVDISNLVMLELGQPNHFYDRRFFNVPEITVIDDYEGQQVGLDGETYQLVKGDTVISSAGQPIGIGGIKGLGNSMIQPDTQSIVIELARFDSVAIRTTSRHLGLVTEASLRYVKPMDPLGPQKALARILYLLKEYADVKDEDICESVIYSACDEGYQPIKVCVTCLDVNQLLGTHFTIDEVMDVFQRLHFQPTRHQETIECTIPSYRQDIFIKEDLIEEVIRVIGFDAIESSLPLMPLTMGALTSQQQQIRLVENILSQSGLNQVITYTLVSKAHTQNPMALSDPIEILSPLSEARQFVRNNLTTSLLDLLNYNLAHKNQNEIYFEISQVYARGKNENRLGIIGSGTLSETTWLKQKVVLDYFAIKGLFEKVLNALGISLSRVKYESNTLDVSTYHPYQSALIKLDNKVIGLMGTIHPRLKLKQAVLLEVNFDQLIDAKKSKTKFKSLQKYPQVTRDLALLVDKEISSAQLLEKIMKAGKPYLVDCFVFDVFETETQNSIGIRLVYQANDHTLLEQEVNTSVETILERLKKDLNALLR